MTPSHTESSALVSRRIHITGVVQGVGFRPFVYNLATRLGLSGWVLNSSSGVEIEAVGPEAVLDEFIARLRTDAPPLARIEQITVTSSDRLPASCDLLPGFRILHSEARPGEFLPISPDVTICDDCLRELFDPRDRRYRYPFINCTNCGPRFTIIRDIPYDRPNTTMAPFIMCPDCQAEYDDPHESPLVAPNNRYLGVMLPYTPLHYLLLEPVEGFPIALVMTSGNFSEEPIVTDNAEALRRLSALADAFLLHDREIHARCDNSVIRAVNGAEYPIRRSRGYAPYPVHLPFPVRQVIQPTFPPATRGAWRTACRWSSSSTTTPTLRLAWPRTG